MNHIVNFDRHNKVCVADWLWIEEKLVDFDDDLNMKVFTLNIAKLLYFVWKRKHLKVF